MGIVARTAYWVEWWRRFGPPSGNEPKLIAPLGRYVIVTFVKDTNMGPYEAARHIPGVSGHELSYVADKHFSIVLLNEAISDLVNAHARLDISQAWGDGTAVAASGTRMDTCLDNLLSETSVRYGKPGGMAYHHVSDTYIALLRHFIPYVVWEAVYIIEGLLKNTSEVQPATVHADTQGHLVTWTPCPSLRVGGGRPGCRVRRLRECLCGYSSGGRRTARSWSNCSTRTGRRSRSLPDSCGFSARGTARRTR
ncbi:Tn3 family transposase [Streptomyces uncialis]|uniref:Tn3 family transposase n=1 Tax=Streptomyces uncialis TaxID=1048205 RepID=UPI00365BBF76